MVGVLGRLDLDIRRTFPDNVRFAHDTKGNLLGSLENVLTAYAHYNKKVGYCQVSRMHRNYHQYLSLPLTVMPGVEFCSRYATVSCGNRRRGVLASTCSSRENTSRE